MSARRSRIEVHFARAGRAFSAAVAAASCRRRSHQLAVTVMVCRGRGSSACDCTAEGARLPSEQPEAASRALSAGRRDRSNSVETRLDQTPSSDPSRRPDRRSSFDQLPNSRLTAPGVCRACACQRLRPPGSESGPSPVSARWPPALPHPPPPPRLDSPLPATTPRLRRAPSPRRAGLPPSSRPRPSRR